MRFSAPVQGDPLTAAGPHHLEIDWIDRVVSGQYVHYQRNSAVNEHANEPKGWRECLEQITDAGRGVDLSFRWWEYRGSACRDGVAAPLVVCLYDYIDTSWQEIADREGLVVLAFEYHRNQRRPEGGLGALGFGPKDDEIEGLDIVIERTIAKYGCDRSRIYMNGLSYGDFSSLIYASRYGAKLAALASVNGPTSPYNMQRYGIGVSEAPLPVLQIRSDSDVSCDGYPAGWAFEMEGNVEWIRNIRSRLVAMNRNVWLRANGADCRAPEIRTEPKRAYLRYAGEKADVIYLELTKKGHIIPIDNAEIMWSVLFSRWRRGADGMPERLLPPEAPERGAIALVAGINKAYIDNRVASLSAPCVVLDARVPQPKLSATYCPVECGYSTFYAPVDILSAGFGVQYSYTPFAHTYSEFCEGTADPAVTMEDGVIAFCAKGKEYRLFTNTCLVSVDGRMRDLERPPLKINGVWMLPVGEIAELLGKFACMRNDAVYITDHPFDMGYTLTRYLREEILAETPYVLRCGVTTYTGENGTFTVSADELAEGETLVIRTQPAPGFRTEAVRTAVNGVAVRANRISDDEYWLCNVLGQAEVAVDFAPSL